MTAKELAKWILESDEEIQDYNIGVIGSIQIHKDARLSVRFPKITIYEDVDVDGETIWLKGKLEEK